MKKFTLLFLCVFAASAITVAQTAQRVKVYEGQETIPTYKMGPDETSPIFYTGRGVQGAAGHVYPYPEQISLGDKLTDETYNMVYLENEYIKVTMLPAFGGKLFSAIDKTNGHELFHRNSTVKPDLIGTLGAWISGGIEWCFPHHHRPSTLLPSDYRMVENPDGSATIWVGETDRTERLRGVIGITLHPGKSYIESTYYLNNPQNSTRFFLFWANVAVTSNETFRTFWPPQQEIGVFHHNNDFTHWPISNETYRRTDYGKDGGTDLTWWKNHPTPISFFFWQGEVGFVGGYDYAQKAGTIHVGDTYRNRTSKLWQFGPGLEGQNARRKLTDDGKAYVELMTGSYSNNQPDYGWFTPHAVKEATNFWYPIRDLEIVKNANTEASVTLQMRDKKTVFWGYNTTQRYQGAKAVLKYGDETLSTQTFDIDPAKPFTATFKSKTELDEYQLYTELQDANGNTLISYIPYKLKHPDLPEVQKEVPAPKDIESVEDLYLAGRFSDQFSRPGINPDDYYFEALKKSPTDYRVNIELGVRRVRQWRYEEAEKYLMTAYDKLQVPYFQPKEGELFYYLALAQKGQGKMEEAYRNFFQATWYYEWFSPSFYQLALIESARGNYAKALEMAQEAYSANNNDGSIVVLNSALMRRLGQKNEALTLVNKLLLKDPINFSAIYEKELLEGNGAMTKWQKNMQDVENNYLDMAMTYVNGGLYDDGLRLLTSLPNPKNPLVYYYLAWLYEKAGQPAKAKEMLTAVTRLSYDYCFPYREETQDILTFAVEKDPQHAEAWYLTGNLLYDRRPEEAMEAWQKAGAITNSIAMVWRNLAFGEFHRNRNTGKSAEYLFKALAADPTQPRWYTDLERYLDMSGQGHRECLAVFEKNIDIVKKDITAPQKLVKLYNLNGDYDKAIDFLKTHHFRTWEGGVEIHNHYVDALTLKGLELAKAGQFREALVKFSDALLYPENLEVGKPTNDDRGAMIWYFMGQTYEQSGQKAKAKEFYTKSSKANNGRWQDLDYYKGKSFEALGQADKAKELYEGLIQRGDNVLERGSSRTGIAVEESAGSNASNSQAYLLQALGNKGLGNAAKAHDLFVQAIKSYSNNLWAKYYTE